MSERWHVSKAIDVGNVVAIIAVIISGVFFIANFDKRLNTVETTQKYIIAQQERDREQTREMLSDMRSDLKYIRERIDEGRK